MFGMIGLLIDNSPAIGIIALGTPNHPNQSNHTVALAPSRAYFVHRHFGIAAIRLHFAHWLESSMLNLHPSKGPAE